jgi:hypothetical protein
MVGGAGPPQAVAPSDIPTTPTKQQPLAEPGDKSPDEQQRFSAQLWQKANAIALDGNFPPLTVKEQSALGYSDQDMVNMAYRFDAASGTWIPIEVIGQEASSTGYSLNFKPIRAGGGGYRPGRVSNPYARGGYSVAPFGLITWRIGLG